MNEYDKNANIKYITKETVYTDETGEHKMCETEIYKKHYGGAWFYRVWLSDFLNALGLINNSKELDVLFHVLDNINSDNTFIGTYRAVADKVNVSLSTVTRIFKKMQESNLLTKIQNGAYKVNPALIMRGDDYKKRRLVIEYEDLKSNNNDTEEKEL